MSAYCTKEEVNGLFGDISDDISDNMFDTSINNADSWINSRLKKYHIPIRYDSSILKSVAIYYSASDILMSLYHGDEYQNLMDYWFEKANQLLNDYIDSYKADNNIDSTVTHRNALTYNERRNKYARRCTRNRANIHS